MSNFSYWGHDEPILPVKRDHWSKLRAKTFTLIALPTGNVATACIPHHRDEHGGSKGYDQHHDQRSAPLSGTTRSIRYSHGHGMESYLSPYGQSSSARPMGRTSARPELRATTGSQLFQDWVQRELASPPPPTSSLPAVQRKRSLSAPGHRSGHAYDNEFNQRARQGFKFWYTEKKKPVGRGAKYTMGTAGTVIGVGQSSTF